MENFRCFAGRHEIPLKPLTVLVGENSSGKSSFLAAVRLAWHSVGGDWNLDFNDEPFSLGSFQHIAGGPGRPRRAPRFALGLGAGERTH